MATNANKPVERSADDLLSEAMDLARKAYWAHIRDLAEDVVDVCKRGEVEDEDGLQTYIHETIDGDGWVIYTAKAQMVLLVSDNDGAYVDNFGEEGMATKDGINWSALAYAAMEADLREHLDVLDFDMNDPESWKGEPEEA